MTRNARNHRILSSTLPFVVAALLMPGLLALSQAPSDRRNLITGRWDITVQEANETSPSWLEIEASGHKTLVGRFVGAVGSARPVSEITLEGDKVVFSVPPQWERRSSSQKFTGKLADGTIAGTTTSEDGREMTWTARRAPDLKRARKPNWGAPINLLPGGDLGGWQPRSPSRPNGWTADGTMLKNARPGNDLVTTRKFDDFKLHAEFRYPQGSNSGIYLRGRYEVQIEDDAGQEPSRHSMGAIYGFFVPSVNPAKKHGEWQTLDAELVGRALTLTINGERVLDRQVIPGITGGALDSREGEPGPLMLQGDHGVVEFRKLTITPAK